MDSSKRHFLPTLANRHPDRSPAESREKRGEAGRSGGIYIAIPQCYPVDYYCLSY